MFHPAALRLQGLAWEQMVTNLLSIAIKFTVGGSVTATARRSKRASSFAKATEGKEAFQVPGKTNVSIEDRQPVCDPKATRP